MDTFHKSSVHTEHFDLSHPFAFNGEITCAGFGEDTDLIHGGFNDIVPGRNGIDGGQSIYATDTSDVALVGGQLDGSLFQDLADLA